MAGGVPLVLIVFDTYARTGTVMRKAGIDGRGLEQIRNVDEARRV